MRKHYVLAMGALIALTTAAAAADIRPVQQRTPTYTPPKQVSVFNWTGLHFEGNLGYGWSGAQAQTGSFGPFSLSGNSDGSGWGYGLGLMALYQPTHNNWAYGLNADWFGLDADGGSAITLSGPGGCGFCGPIAGSNYRHEVSSVARVTGVLGYAQDRVLLFVDGGLAYGKGKARATIGGFSTSDSENHTGWTLGAGIKWAAVGNWTVTSKYDFVRLKDETYGFAAGPLSVPTRTNLDDIHVIKVGLGYKF
jgi:outer membrane immunogenic protein